MKVSKYIRNELENHFTRVVLRTGQPGFAPIDNVMKDYDIDGYLAKTEITRHKLNHTCYIALRSYRDLTRIKKYQKGLEAVINAIANLTQIDEVLDLELVNKSAIEKAKFKVVVDGVNSTGGIAIPLLLERLGVHAVKLYCDPTGHFPHNPEPLKEHLTDLSEEVVKERADFGIVVDPDVDRLAFVDETGEMFGEEYTLVACADYVLSKTSGNTVSNMSSTRALRDVTEKHGGIYQASAVGEVNVVNLMKKNNAVIGGEGNGGIIYPDSHYGRDALVGVALFLSLLAEKKMKVSELRASYPNYFMSKKKIQLTPELDVDGLLVAMENKYSEENLTTIDGVKIDFSNSWVHLRKSNTEPIIRIYTEAPSQNEADSLADRIILEIKAIANI